MGFQSSARVVKAALLTASVAALSSGSAVYAQVPNDPQEPSTQTEAEARTAPGGLQDIVVTARKREESLQDVPIAVTAFSGDALREAQITDLSQIAGRTPSFTFQTQGLIEQEAFIRGVGSVRLTSATADPSIGLFVNEVYIGRRGAASPPIFDLERVEVLRGPQGTIFGKNVVGGAVSLITARPTYEPSAGAQISVGNYGAIASEGHVSGQIGEGIAARLALYQNAHDGYAKNIVNGQELEDLKSFAGRFSLIAEPTENLTLSLIFDGSKDRGGGQSRHAVDDPTRPGFGPITPNLISDDPRTTETPYFQYNRRGTYGITGRADYDFGGMTLTYLAALRHGDARQRFAQAGAGSPPSFTDSVLTQREEYQGLTQELRLASDQAQRFRWLGGLYYLREETDRSSQNTATSFLPGGPGSTRDSLDGDNVFTQNGVAQNYAVFGEAEFDILENLTVSVGGRYTVDKKTMDARAEVLSFGLPGDILSPAPLQAPYNISVRKTWKEFTPKVALEWRATDNVLVYASAAKGFKGGGWQSATANAAAASLAYDPETAWNYEVGVKSDLFDRRLRLNVAAFRLDFKDLQVEQLDDVRLTTVVANAADAKIQGIELETQLVVTEGLSLFASGSVLDAKYKEYIDRARNLNFTGNQLLRTPDYQYTVGADYRVEVGENYAIKAHVDYTYQDNFFYGPDNTNFEPGYGLLDARIGFGDSEDRWSVTLYGKNLTNKLYRVSVIPFLGDESSLYGPPRTYGVRFASKF
ncbi:TonB-dependent receptor [Allosphingosinicella indica]|uniref:Iron complex outermembrane recepter protein n=1 Tax=Allosphingosinicella indica TaxID=941907 RepID=A0A1X7G0L9_9SPHN|nr:TonB-dependent receptor [Allosphingosinicella indica]SMF61910.1 iron complex outermembrane recepter protein [Allosphingosinicella indica]